MRSTRDTFQFGPECVARGFQTLFIVREAEEGVHVMLIKTSGIDPRYDICYFSDNIFIPYLILSPQMITPGLDLSDDARGTENCNSVPVGTEFQNMSKIS